MKNYNFKSKVKYIFFSIILLSCGNGNMNSMNSKEIDMVNSHIHVMTRLQGRNNISSNDISIQKLIFNQKIQKVGKSMPKYFISFLKRNLRN